MQNFLQSQIHRWSRCRTWSKRTSLRCRLRGWAEFYSSDPACHFCKHNSFHISHCALCSSSFLVLLCSVMWLCGATNSSSSQRDTCSAADRRHARPCQRINTNIAHTYIKVHKLLDICIGNTGSVFTGYLISTKFCCITHSTVRKEEKWRFKAHILFDFGFLDNSS